jgi:hypothetical protein
MLKRMKRIWCSLFGCIMAEDYPACERCGEGLYYGYYDTGKLWWFQSRYWLWKSHCRAIFRAAFGPLPKCNVCGKTMRRWTDRNESCCSEECYFADVPF